MSAYYNEHDKFSAAWLRELIAAGVIAGGEVDERNIQDVRADELRGFTQCHFFAGIGVWSYALRSAGWPDEKPAWTGSCPCQPFSVSGKRAGASDGRHLWPCWFPLIRESRPVVVFGEQVASDDGLAWLDLVSSDLERSDYAVGAVDTCAAGFGAPHIRQRLYFVAESQHAQRRQITAGRNHGVGPEAGRDESAGVLRERGEAGELADHGRGRRDSPGSRDAGNESASESQRDDAARRGRDGELGNAGRASAARFRQQRRESEAAGGLRGRPGDTGELGVASLARLERRQLDRGLANHPEGRLDAEASRSTTAPGNALDVGNADEPRSFPGAHRGLHRGQAGAGPRDAESQRSSFWSDAEWLPCRDGKARPVEPGTFPLAHGVAGRVGRLRGYGNALCAPQAEAFIRAYLEARCE